jgi:hypothetical protein
VPRRAHGTQGPADLHVGASGRPRALPEQGPRSETSGPAGRYASAFALIASNSAWVIVPASSRAFAFSISAAEPPETERT